MIGLWLSLILSYAGFAAVLGAPLDVVLPLAAILASLTVMFASLVRLVFACAQGRALAGGVAAMCAFLLVLVLAGAELTDFNARVGERAIWINGSLTGTGAVGLVFAIGAIALAALVGYVISQQVARLFRRPAD